MAALLANSFGLVFKQYRVWDKKKPLYQHALTHISLANAEQALGRLAQVDLLSKTSSEFNIFILLAEDHDWKVANAFNSN